MLKLYGFAASNYYNKVKLALMEKGIPFEERCAGPTRPTATSRRCTRCLTWWAKTGGCANRRSSSITSRRAIRSLR